MAKPKASAADDKEKPAKPTASDRHLEALRHREKSLQDRIANRIPNYPDSTRESAMAMAVSSLDTIRAKIKAHSK